MQSRRGIVPGLGVAWIAVALAGPALAGTVYTANEVANTVSVIDTEKNAVASTLGIGDENIHRPLYNGIIDAHGAGLSPDGNMLAITGRGSSNVILIDTRNNAIWADVVVGREPHVPTFTPDGRQVWVTVRGGKTIAVIDLKTFEVSAKIPTVNGPSMVWFSPDGTRAFVGSQKEATLAVIDVATHKTVATIPVAGNFSPFVKVSPDGREVWVTHKSVDKVSVIDARTYQVLQVLEVGARPNHVEFVRRDGRDLVYVTIGKTNLPPDQRGGENLWVIDRATRQVVKRLATGGREAHGIWASPDGSRLYIGHEVSNDVVVLDTATESTVATIPVGKKPIDVVYRP